MIVVFLGLTLFLSAFLLFCVQPMVAKMALPFLGGSASVWATCVLFFQSTLLIGYIYAHAVARRLRLKTQLFVHAGAMALVFAFLPISFAGAGGEAPVMGPTAWLLWRLVLAAGIPFLVVSASAPLVQNWLARTNLESRRDPYVLYAASNAGSLLALVIYPLAVEPWMGARAQSLSWVAGYGLLVVMIVISAFLAWRRSDPHSQLAEMPSEDNEEGLPAAVGWWSRAYWLGAAFVPAALMLAVTNQISMDVASVPFLWILPLAVYLVTFILAFSKPRERSQRSARFIGDLAPVMLLVLLPIIPITGPDRAVVNWLLAAGHLTVLFVGAYLCHTALAVHRPHPRDLTAFYLWIALGGALGGLFVALIAPWVFTTVLEYPLLVAALPFFRILREDQTWNWKDWAWPVAFLGAALAVQNLPDPWYRYSLTAVLAGISLLRRRRLRFALAFGAILAAYTHSTWELTEGSERLTVARNFFGAKKVLFDRTRQMRKLLHGDTVHGYESVDPALAGEPLSYYHREGPVGDVMRAIGRREDQRVGVVGLGTGSMAAYAGPNRQVTFFDVDPQVVGIARNYFTFLERCGSQCAVVLGDGRLSIGKAPDGTFDVLMLDAFNSDSIPAHLVSREAIKVYLKKLKSNGMIMFHVSSRYLNIARLVAAGVSDAHLIAYVRSDGDEGPTGKLASTYIVVARDVDALEKLPVTRGWAPLPAETKMAPWTDDYSNMLGLIAWPGAWDRSEGSAGSDLVY
ncbi:MAG TPA: fused MFS/spermidine synthase [Terriglobia bacterium]|nr:fused MFS/spermidine synthase [Terriglobia bacterium]